MCRSCQAAIENQTTRLQATHLLALDGQPFDATTEPSCGPQ